MKKTYQDIVYFWHNGTKVVLYSVLDESHTEYMYDMKERAFVRDDGKCKIFNLSACGYVLDDVDDEDESHKQMFVADVWEMDKGVNVL